MVFLKIFIPQYFYIMSFLSDPFKISSGKYSFLKPGFNCVLCNCGDDAGLLEINAK